MSNEIVPFEPAPDGDDNQQRNNEQQRGDPHGGKKRQRRRGNALSREDCLTMLSQLPSLITLGILTPAKANSIRSTLQAILAETRDAQSTGASPAANEDLIRALKDNPTLLRSLEPLLTDEQLEMILREIADDDKPEA